MMTNFDMIGEQIPIAALYEQLAEEAIELAHAAQKYARILRKENPTILSVEDGRKQLIEEYTDVTISAMAVQLNMDEAIFEKKMNRWLDRITDNAPA